MLNIMKKLLTASQINKKYKGRYIEVSKGYDYEKKDTVMKY